MDDLPRSPDEEDLVLTPGGMRPRRQVTKVEPGHGVRSDVAGQMTVGLMSRQHAARRASMARDLVLTPGGYRNRALVHRLEPGEVVQHDRDRIRLFHTPTKTSKDLAEVALQPGDVPGFGTGWIVYGA